MKSKLQIPMSFAVRALALAGMIAALSVAAANAAAEVDQSISATGGAVAGGGGGGGGGFATASDPAAVEVSSIELSGGKEADHEDRPWLGVSIDEGSEALASQLGLAPGTGLVVTYVEPDSPAAKAGLQKNDVLVQLNGQQLVVPAQFKKLIQVSKVGDAVELVLYRAGKKQEVSATLGKAPAGAGLFGKRHAWDGAGGQWGNLFDSDAMRREMKVLRDSMGNVKVDTAKVQDEVRRSMERAQRAMENALRASSNAAWGPASNALRELRRYGMRVDNNPSVTVRSTGHRVRSIVKADDSGTIVIVCNPEPRLTAHDANGKLLFDGEIDTAEQRAKVPPELWEKVEPMLDKVGPSAEEESEPAPSSPGEK